MAGRYHHHAGILAPALCVADREAGNRASRLRGRAQSEKLRHRHGRQRRPALQAGRRQRRSRGRVGERARRATTTWRTSRPRGSRTCSVGATRSSLKRRCVSWVRCWACGSCCWKAAVPSTARGSKPAWSTRSARSSCPSWTAVPGVAGFFDIPGPAPRKSAAALRLIKHSQLAGGIQWNRYRVAGKA